jgi:hypothetical protein
MPSKGTSFRVRPQSETSAFTKGFLGLSGAEDALKDNIEKATNDVDLAIEEKENFHFENFVSPEISPEFQSNPFFKDQLAKFPKTCRIGPVQYKVFCIPREIDALNMFVAQASPSTSPKILLSSKENISWCADTKEWYVLVKYKKVEYKKPV